MRTRSFAYVGLALVIGAFVFGGCGFWKKYSANSAIKKVRETVAQAQQQEADRYAWNIYTQAESLINQAEADVQAGNYDEAIEKTKEAETRAQQAMAQVASNRQVIQTKRAELTELDNRLEDILSKAEASPSREIAELEIVQARESYNAIKAEIQQQLGKRAQIAAEYDNLIARVQEMGEQVQRAYDLTLADSANALAQSITTKLGTLQEMQFTLYMPQMAQAVNQQYEEFRRAIEGNAFERALSVGNLLDATLTQQIPVARRVRAEQSVANAETGLSQAAALGGLQFSPEQLRAGQQSLAEARAQLELQEYDQAYNLALQAMGSADVAMDEVKRSIETQIETIQGRIIEAEESNATVYAPQELARSRDRLARAFDALTDKDYQTARNLQVEAANAVEDAFVSAKRGKAQEKLDRITSVIARARAQGAATYVPQSLVAVEEKLAEARAIFNRGEYVEVHPVADLAENLAQKTLADLRELGEERIELAHQQIDAARVAKAEEYAREMLRQAENDLSQSKVQLAAEEFKRSLELLDQSIRAGKQAEDQAYRLRTDEKLASAEIERQLAIDSGAREHSAAIFLAAVENEGLARRRYAAGEYQLALEAGTASDDGFRGARMSKITRASESTRSAVEALAEQYAAELISQAQGLLAQAKLDMDNRFYQDSNRKADEANRLAIEAETLTWKKRSEDRIAAWEKALQQAIVNHAQDKAPESLEQSRLAGVTAKAEYAVRNYRASYEHAVQADEALDRTNQKLAVEAQTTLAMMKDKLDELSALAVDEPGRAMVNPMIQLRGKTELARQAGNYQEVFNYEKQFVQQNTQLQNQLKMHNMTSLRTSLLSRLQDLKGRGLAKFLPEQTVEAEKKLQAFSPSSRMEDYAEAYAELKSIEDQFNQFPAMVDAEVQKTIGQMQSQLNEARHAGALELIPDQYADAVEAYKRFLNYPRDQVTNYNEFYTLFDTARQKSEKAYAQTNLAIAIRNYRDVLQSYMTEMSSLLDSFSSVTDFDRRFYVASASTRQVDVYRELQYNITASALRRRSELLLDKARELQPPQGQEAIQAMALKTFEELVVMSRLFERFGEYEKYDKMLRDQYILQAFDSLDKVRSYTSQVQRMMVDEGPRSRPFTLRFWEYF